MRFFSQCARSLIPTYKVAVVGSGPAAFYTAYHVLNKCPRQKFNIKLDFFEKLPAPFGLSRYGVAPDHPEVKNCEDYLRDIMVDYKDDVRFFGNVEVGKDVTLQDLQHSYHSICLAYGCITGDNQLSIPGSDCPQVISARKFVNWYNGHPEFYQDDEFTPPALDKIKNVTIIGNGNVAMDVARVLLADINHWKPTDISLDALKLLSQSTVQNVNIVARRGLLESAFTTKEIRELLDLNKSGKVKFIPIDSELWHQFEPKLKDLDRPNKRKFTTIQKYLDQDVPHASKTWSLQYLKTPAEFVSENNKLVKTIFTNNEVVEDQQGSKIVPVEGPNKFYEIENDLVILSIGYKGSPLPGLEDQFINNQGKLNHKGGRLDLKGYYTSGWIKNGPKGIIATTMMDSFDTGFNMLEDLNQQVFIDSKKTDILDILPQKTVHWNNWINLNNYELQRGKEMGKSRDKVCQPNKMIEIACK